MLTDEQVARAFIILHIEGECPIKESLVSKNLAVDGYELRSRKSGKIVARYSSGDFITTTPDHHDTLEKYLTALFEQMLAEYKESDDKLSIRNAIYQELEPVTGQYTQYVMDAIADDVIEDVRECAADNWSLGDVDLAISRVLCSRLGIEI